MDSMKHGYPDGQLRLRFIDL